MSLWTIITLALSRILANRSRSFLTMLGVIIGVASLVTLTSITNGATSGITSSFSSLGTNTISVQGTTASALTESDAEALGAIPGVAAISTTVRGDGTAAHGASTSAVSLIGVSANYAQVNTPDLAIGSFLPTFDGSDAVRDVVLSSTAAGTLAIANSDIGKEITLDGIPFTLIGVLDDATGREATGTAYVSSSSARSLFAQAPYIAGATIEATDSGAVDAVEASADSLLRERYGLSTDDDAQFTTTTQASLLTTLSTIQGLLATLVGGIASISLVVGGIGIMNIMLVSVRERRQEIGVRRAIGARRSQVLAQFIIEAIVLSVTGGLIGLGVGAIVAAIAAAVGGWAFVVGGSTIAVALIFSAAVGVIFGVWPARTAARLQPIEALRSE